MDNIYRAILAFHVVASIVGLLAMFPALAARKGARLHARAGFTFSYGMALSSITGLLLAGAWAIAPSRFQPGQSETEARLSGLFLLLIALLTGNAIMQAHGALARKSRPEAQVNLRSLWTVALLGTSALASVAIGIVMAHTLSLIFGLGALLLTARDTAFVVRPLPHKRAYLYQHIQAMGTACIAAVTAFLVLGGRRLFSADIFGGPSWLMWVLPGMTMAPMFQLTVQRWKRRFEKPSRPPAAQTSLAKELG